MPADSSIYVGNAHRHYTLRHWPDTCGWLAILPEDGPDLEVSFYRAGTRELVGETRFAAGSPGMVNVRLPWPTRDICELDLVLRAVSSPGSEAIAPLFLVVHRALARKKFVEMAKGTGVEIGPGAQPQILVSEDVTAYYLEQMHPEKWHELYNKAGKYNARKELWSNYIIGDAANIPCEDETLDFIFSSHVFEHLANPIGHLERWSRKLKPGGRVLCVVPDLGGSKDYFQQPSELRDLQAEFAADIWEPTLAHYVRHMRRQPDDPKLQQAMRDRESIHVHYYTNTNCERLLSYVREALDFSSFSMTWTHNHKDFYFSLTKA